MMKNYLLRPYPTTMSWCSINPLCIYKGLCGSLNSEDLTGWKLRDDSSTNNLDLFARSWQVHARCIEKPIFHNNCNVDRELSDAEVNECDVLKHDIFNPCRETKAGKFLDDFYMECKQELCSCVTETKLERCTCGIIAEMASLCSEELNGANFEWRQYEKKCGNTLRLALIRELKICLGHSKSPNVGPSDKICKTVKIHAGYVDIVLTGNGILIDGDEISKLPIIKHNSISVRRASYSTIIGEFNNYVS
ncbi:hypothetical protein B566_EDAN015119 [Ephemera danica]|nr:hypothetical protein B566_EDAN015119 [Ephemera danica]